MESSSMNMHWQCVSAVCIPSQSFQHFRSISDSLRFIFGCCKLRVSTTDCRCWRMQTVISKLALDTGSQWLAGQTSRISIWLSQVC